MRAPPGAHLSQLVLERQHAAGLHVRACACWCPGMCRRARSGVCVGAPQCGYGASEPMAVAPVRTPLDECVMTTRGADGLPPASARGCPSARSLWSCGEILGIKNYSGSGIRGECIGVMVGERTANMDFAQSLEGKISKARQYILASTHGATCKMYIALGPAACVRTVASLGGSHLALVDVFAAHSRLQPTLRRDPPVLAGGMWQKSVPATSG